MKTKGSKIKGKTSYPESFPVPKYPFSAKDETIKLNSNDYILLTNCVAPRIRKFGVIRADVKYRWSGNKKDLKRLKYLFRRFVIDKNIYSDSEAKSLTIFEVIDVLRREFGRETDRLNALWKNALRIPYETGLSCLDYWRGQIEQFIKILEKSQEATIVLPYMEPAEGTLIDGFRLPTPDDLPYMYTILGLMLEWVFGINEVFVNKKAKSRLSKLHKYENLIIGQLDLVTLEELKTYWNHINFDIQKCVTSLKAENTKVSLREFLEKRTDVDPRHIDSKLKRIKAINKKQSILPRAANNPKKNQTRLYYEIELEKVWSALKDQIPTLPNIKK